MFQACRPAGRLFYLVLALLAGLRIGVAARAGSPTPQSGPPLTSVVDTVYRADGTTAQGVLVITWPAFVATNGVAVSEGAVNVTLGTNGALNVSLAANAGNKTGVEKKDAAMSFLQNALSTIDAVANREIIDPVKFKDGISKIIDGTVECLNASTWCKQPPAPSTQPSA
jgi:hypothetical protein